MSAAGPVEAGSPRDLADKQGELLVVMTARVRSTAWFYAGK